LPEIGQDSHLRFNGLYCNLLKDHVLAKQKGKTEHKEKSRSEHWTISQGKLYMHIMRTCSTILHVKTYAMN